MHGYTDELLEVNMDSSVESEEQLTAAEVG
jgi:hypothetical protein